MAKKYVEVLFSKVYKQGLKQKHIDYLNTHALSKKELKYIKRQLKIFYVENKNSVSVFSILIAAAGGAVSIIYSVSLGLYFEALLVLILINMLIDTVRRAWTMWKIKKLTKNKYRKAFEDIMIEYRR